MLQACSSDLKDELIAYPGDWQSHSAHLSAHLVLDRHSVHTMELDLAPNGGWTIPSSVQDYNAVILSVFLPSTFRIAVLFPTSPCVWIQREAVCNCVRLHA